MHHFRWERCVLALQRSIQSEDFIFKKGINYVFSNRFWIFGLLGIYEAMLYFLLIVFIVLLLLTFFMRSLHHWFVVKDQKCLVHYESSPTFCTVIYRASIPVVSLHLYTHGSITKIKRLFIEHRISMGPLVSGSYKFGNTIDSDWPDKCHKTEVWHKAYVVKCSKNFYFMRNLLSFVKLSVQWKAFCVHVYPQTHSCACAVVIYPNMAVFLAKAKVVDLLVASSYCHSLCFRW